MLMFNFTPESNIIIIIIIIIIFSSSNINIIIIFEQDQDGTAFPSWSCSKAVYKPVWHMPLLSVQWITPWLWTDELSETCRVSWQNKFMILVHLVGFIIKKFVTMYGHTNVKKIAPIVYIDQSHINQKFGSSVTSSYARWITVPKNRRQHRDNRLKSHATHRCVLSIRDSCLVL